ncbi:MAG: diaminopimelate epimerase [Candidatus Omnitrophota bacterium]|nr:diaminopimelate epimerase [Candidatus Omnitrophota bacterium]
MSGKYNVNFTKAMASGNDFIIIDNKRGELDARQLDYPEMARELCPRKLSIGADGLLILEDSDRAVFRMRIINPDGSEVDMCGNGARCSAFYAAACGWGEDLSIETGSGILAAQVDGGNVKIRMSDPRDIKLDINLGIGSSIMKICYINTGVPHVVHFVDDLEGYQVKETGRKIREHSLFSPEGTNVDFVGEMDADNAAVRTYERGVEDETLACGTGVVASAVVMGLLGCASSPVRVRTRSGDTVNVYFNLSGQKVTDVYLEGKASIVYEGKV